MATEKGKSRRYFIKTYGCAMNVFDSGKLAQVLEFAGWQEAQTQEQADIILVNTCVVRQHAEDRAAGYITSMKNLKLKNPNLKIALCGCFVTEPGRDVKKQFPHVDWFIPPNSPDRLAEFLRPSPSRPEQSRGTGRGGQALVPAGEGFVTIAHGCDNYCSYCVVPYVRGREYSRPMDEVLSEIKGLVEQGVTDITLLGQNVNSYKYGLAKLFREIGKIIQYPHPLNPPLHLRWRGGNPNEVREGVRFLTSHPRDMSDEIIEAVADLPYVAKGFMMPLQSGDDEILKKMNRGYTLHYYIDRVSKIRSLLPQARIITDILVGFPGETEEQFRKTLRAVETIKFDEVHMFAYSDRPGTAAEKMEGKVPDEVKRDRLRRLIELVREVVRLYHVQ